MRQDGLSLLTTQYPLYFITYPYSRQQYKSNLPSDISTTNVCGTSSALTTAHTCWRNKKIIEAEVTKKYAHYKFISRKFLLNNPTRNTNSPPTRIYAQRKIPSNVSVGLWKLSQTNQHRARIFLFQPSHHHACDATGRYLVDEMEAKQKQSFFLRLYFWAKDNITIQDDNLTLPLIKYIYASLNDGGTF